MAEEVQNITVRPKGPYIVRGGIPLVRKAPVMSEYGEPLRWEEQESLSADNVYRLCRCGQSSTKPFCDGTHTIVEFDGVETADPGPIADRLVDHEGDEVVVRDDRSLCVHAGFCGTRLTNIWKLLEKTDDAQARAQIIGMVEHCPSGALAYSMEAKGETIEQDLPKEISVIPDGPYWVTGGINVERRDGKPIEPRNRVTLCRCGGSKSKPLCDGTHKEIGFSDG